MQKAHLYGSSMRIAASFLALVSTVTGYSYGQSLEAQQSPSDRSGLAPTVAEPVKTRPWPHELTDIPPDASLHFGRLDNGLRFVWCETPNPKGEVQLWLHVAAGSLVEEDGQRGMAHVIEHMGFNGTENYKSGEIARWGQSFGLDFGAHLNAFTSYSNTTYCLKLSDINNFLLMEALKILREFAGGMQFSAQELAAELAVIDAEERENTSPEHRTHLILETWKFDGTRRADHSPIGLHTDRSRFRPDDLRAFYKRWYAAPNLTLVLVGDLNGDPTSKIERIFGDLESADRQPATWPDMGRLKLDDAAFAHANDDLGLALLHIEWVRGWDGKLPDRADLSNQQLISVALEALNRKLSKCAAGSTSAILRAEASLKNGTLEVPLQGFEINLSAIPGKWESALAEVHRELAAVLANGFTDDEFAWAVNHQKHSLEQWIGNKEKLSTELLVGSLLKMANGDSTIPDPQKVVAAMLIELTGIDADECHAVLTSEIAKGKQRFSVIGPMDLGDDAESRILAAWRAESRKPEQDAASDSAKVFQYLSADLVPAKKDLDWDRIGDWRWSKTLENGVRLFGIQSSGELVHVRALVGDGNRSLAPKLHFMSHFANHVIPEMGLGAHSQSEWQNLLIEHEVDLRFDSKPGALVYEGYCQNDQLLLQCELISAHIADPGKRDVALEKLQAAYPDVYEALRRTPEGVIQTEFIRELYGDSEMRIAPTPEELSLLTIDTFRSWIAPQLKDGPITVILWGNTTPEEAIAIAERTFGTLGTRKAFDHIKSPAPLNMQSGLVREYSIPASAPYALVQVYWPGPDAVEDPKREWEQTLLAGVLQDRLRERVREELGLSYAPSVIARVSDLIPGEAAIIATVSCEPEQLDRALEVILSLADELARDGFEPEELERVSNPLLTLLNEEDWMVRLSRQHTKPYALDELGAEHAFLRIATPNLLSAAARSQFQRVRASIAFVRPED